MSLFCPKKKFLEIIMRVAYLWFKKQNKTSWVRAANTLSHQMFWVLFCFHYYRLLRPLSNFVTLEKTERLPYYSLIWLNYSHDRTLLRSSLHVPLFTNVLTDCFFCKVMHHQQLIQARTVTGHSSLSVCISLAKVFNWNQQKCWPLKLLTTNTLHIMLLHRSRTSAVALGLWQDVLIQNWKLKKTESWQITIK